MRKSNRLSKTRIILWLTLCIFVLTGWSGGAGHCADDALILRFLENSKFDYNGEAHEIKHPDIRDGKVVFYINLYSETPVSYFKAGDGSQIPLNFKVFTTDLLNGKLSNIKRLTAIEGVHEIDPLWLDGNTVAYIERAGNDSKSSAYRMSDIEGKINKTILDEEYNQCKKRREFFIIGPSVIRTLKIDCKKEKPGYIKSIAFSPDGKYLAAIPTENSYGDLTIWGTKNFNLLTSLAWYDGTGGESFCNRIIFSPDSKYIALACWYAVKFWSMDKTTLVKTMDGDFSVAFSPDGKRVATSKGVFSFPEFKLIKKSQINSLEFCNENPRLFSADGKYLIDVYGFYDPDLFTTLVMGPGRAIRFRNADTLEPVKTLKVPAFRVEPSPDGKYLISDSFDRDNYIHIFGLKSFEEIKKVENDHKPTRLYGVFSPNSRYFMWVNILAKSEDRAINILNMDSMTVQYVFKSPRGITGLAISPDGKYLAMGDEGNTIHIWDMSPLLDNNKQGS